MSAGSALAVALAAVAGLGGAVQAAVMGELGKRVGVVPALAFSGVVTLSLALAALIAVERSVGGLREAAREPLWLWTGGALSLLIILAVTVGPPRIGIAATIGTVIAGNLVMGTIVDRYGLFGADRIEISWPRLVGLVLLAVGAALSLHRG